MDKSWPIIGGRIDNRQDNLRPINGRNYCQLKDEILVNDSWKNGQYTREITAN